MEKPITPINLVRHLSNAILKELVIKHLIAQENKFEFWLQYETLNYFLGIDPNSEIEIEKALPNLKAADLFVKLSEEPPLFIEYKMMIKNSSKGGYQKDVKGFFSDINKLKTIKNGAYLSILLAYGGKGESVQGATYSDYLKTQEAIYSSEYGQKINYEQTEEFTFRYKSETYSFQFFYSYGTKQSS